MLMVSLYNFDDQLIREMVSYNHRPEEMYSSGSGLLTTIKCEKCHNQWPCPPIAALRGWKKDRQEYLSSLIEKGDIDGD